MSLEGPSTFQCSSAGICSLPQHLWHRAGTCFPWLCTEGMRPHRITHGVEQTDPRWSHLSCTDSGHGLSSAGWGPCGGGAALHSSPSWLRCRCLCICWQKVTWDNSCAHCSWRAARGDRAADKLLDPSPGREGACQKLPGHHGLREAPYLQSQNPRRVRLLGSELGNGQWSVQRLLGVCGSLSRMHSLTAPSLWAGSR